MVVGAVLKNKYIDDSTAVITLFSSVMHETLVECVKNYLTVSYTEINILNGVKSHSKWHSIYMVKNYT